jgi:plastocyanin
VSSRAFVCVFLTLGLLGCDGKNDGVGPDASTTVVDGGTDGETVQESSSQKPRKPWEPTIGTATVKGVVRFDGEPPKRRKLDMGSDPGCCRLHNDSILDEILLISADGTLKNVYVWVKRGLDDWEFPVPTETVLLDQVGCTFQPHVLAVRAGQQVEIRNSDPVFHNVHAVPTRNTGFNFSQAQQGMSDTRVFKLPETSIQIKCDIHGWMSNYVHVSPHPYFAVTETDGVFEFPNLPPGEFVIEAVHEYLGKKTAKITVADGEAQEIEFSFEER